MQSNKNIRNWVGWFEIPVTDFDRAKAFYESIFEINFEVSDFGNFKMAIFPHKERKKYLQNTVSWRL